ncbi:hypothetical protein ABEY46_11230 [Bacillus velezensis]|uniref:hypothetical protein n=1 Tax=Bacillus velezensis TaxID=492670 RepID=UPI000532A702|nr:hypothetical protein [Bacillus velezensis]MEC3797965.1 hypothetical protein [Bacillus velezensis]
MMGSATDAQLQQMLRIHREGLAEDAYAISRHERQLIELRIERDRRLANIVALEEEIERRKG